LELDAYFKGALKKFTVPLDLQGSDFQKKVWMELLTIPYGETRSYEQQTTRLGDLKAIRAVASANGKNRIAIVVPCHRVIGKNGSLTGYAGGLDKKLWLLDFESKHSGKSFQTSLEF
jgi:O-6-methylguanine DNA methyltransferase